VLWEVEGEDEPWGTKFRFVDVIFSKIDWNLGQGHGKILKNAGPPKSEGLFGNT